MRKWLVAGTALIALMVTSFACDSDSDEPDEVVGVLLKCTYPARTQRTFDGNDNVNITVIPARELSSAQCEKLLGDAPDRQRAIDSSNAHYVVTVRTANGGSYTVEVPATRRVRVGQEWPLY